MCVCAALILCMWEVPKMTGAGNKLCEFLEGKVCIAWCVCISGAGHGMECDAESQ